MSLNDTLSPVTLSASAAARVKRVLSGEAPGSALRVAVDGGGCSGFQYSFTIVRDVAADDLVLQRDGATVLIDPMSVDYMRGSEIDFVDDLIGQSFKIHNPNATASCGCGTSFAL
ncbi:iron-sulfur cluster insertion protein ErpA [Lichenibacterium minor]|uniref:Iron-sulfur cluster insertion protein ErpA n=1 Tax=Lichenibacterium minor TaxID=2316528 RepID=A0A4Q2UCB4_9HYPH|nr:iron-sulfur cluster insertion protein ErpA [Lichenibacterium minor]RYC32891.1 iron-sulfur cluster insertion protein ErpA [Lichenibacterium minor]